MRYGERYTFAATLERQTDRGGVTIDWEYDVDVVYRYAAERPGKMYLPNGDPGYPTDPAEVEILSVTPRDPDVGGDLVADDRLTDKELERLIDLAHGDHAKQLYDPSQGDGQRV